MNKFDIFVAGFNNLDETINFGKRITGGDKSLYEICTLAVIRSSDKSLNSEGRLKFTSYYQVGSQIFFGINNCLRVVRSIEQPDQIANFEFESCLDNIVVSICEKFLLVCTKNGNIFIRDLSEIVKASESDDSEKNFSAENNICNNESGNENCNFNCPLIFQEKLEILANDSQTSFIGACTDKTSKYPTFYVVTCNGLIKKITLSPEDSQFKSETLTDLKRNIKICSFASPYLCLEGQELMILNLKTLNYDIDDCLGLKCLQAIGSNFFAMDYYGNIYKIHPGKFLIFNLNDELPDLVNIYDDLSVLADKDRKIVVGITKENESKIKAMELLEFAVMTELPRRFAKHFSMERLRRDCLEREPKSTE